MHRYPALRSIANIYKALAYLIGAIAAVGIIMGLSYLDNQFQRGFGITLLLQSIIGGAVGFITLLAAAEIIKVFIDIEENTRKTAEIVHGGGITPESSSRASYIAAPSRHFSSISQPNPTPTSHSSAGHGETVASEGLEVSSPSIPEGYEEYKLSPAEAAQAIGVTRGTLQGYVQSGRLSANPDDGTITAASLLRAGFIIRHLPSRFG